MFHYSDGVGEQDHVINIYYKRDFEKPVVVVKDEDEEWNLILATIKSLSESVTAVGAAAVGTSFLSNFFCGMSVVIIWTLINGLQTIVHLPLFNV